MVKLQKTALQRLQEKHEAERRRADERRIKRLGKDVKESQVARSLVEAVRSCGGLIFKQHPLTNRGIPDYLVISPRGRVAFVETKTTGESCTPIQLEFHKLLKQKGIETYTLDRLVVDYHDLFTQAYKTYVPENDPAYGRSKTKKVPRV